MNNIKHISLSRNNSPPQNDFPKNVELIEIAHKLSERVKELNCLYGISRLFENTSISIEEILYSVVKLIPPAWQYPEITCARIKLEDTSINTPNFKETNWCQTQSIIVDSKIFGTLEVYYLVKKPLSDEGPFLKEERNLLRVIAERLGNIIEHKIAEENLKDMYAREKELHKKLQMEMKARVDLTHKLIHELKTPLTALYASSQMLYNETKDKKLEKLTKHILNGANNLNNRIEELNDVVKGEMGKLRLTLNKVDIAHLLRILIEEAGALAKHYNIDILLESEDNLPQIEADSDRIRQIIFNLINNACKYAHEGKIINIIVTMNNGFIRIEVKDYGPGIAKKRQLTLFEPGYQTVVSDNSSGGLGIGLALCKMLVELHGGKMWVNSKLGHGSSFYFTLPVKTNSK
jgi:signal transduction histidine kinase